MQQRADGCGPASRGGRPQSRKLAGSGTGGVSSTYCSKHHYRAGVAP